MSEINDGGPAFPVPYQLGGSASKEPRDILSTDGMSLRAYYAGQFLSALIISGQANGVHTGVWLSDVKRSIKGADWLIAELNSPVNNQPATSG